MLRDLGFDSLDRIEVGGAAGTLQMGGNPAASLKFLVFIDHCLAGVVCEQELRGMQRFVEESID